jgi:hypothetical protein
MKTTFLMVVAGIVVVLAGIGVFLATWNSPAPSAVVEIVIPNDRFSR